MDLGLFVFKISQWNFTISWMSDFGKKTTTRESNYLEANLEHIFNFSEVKRISMYLEFRGHLQTTIFREVPHFQKN